MYEAIEYYQGLAEKFDSRILLVPGVVVVVVGLCIWLAGLRWRKVLGALAGGSFFAGIGLFVGINDVMILVVVLIGIVLGVLIEKLMLGIFGTALTGTIVIIAASMVFEQRDYAAAGHPRWSEYERDDAVIGFAEAVEVTRETARYILLRTIENVKSRSLVSGVSLSMSILLAGFAATMLPRFFIAAVSSSFGSAIIFAGMIMLLFYKGSKPVNYISAQGTFYAMVIFAMIIFGAAVQLILSPSATQMQKAESNNTGDKK